MEDWIKLVSTVGFPIVVTLYVLLRLESTMKTLTEVVRKLIVAMVRAGIDVSDINGPEKKE